MKEIKKALRKSVFAEIESLPDEYIARSDEGIYSRVVSSIEFQGAASIFTYYSVGREPDTRRIIERALELGKTVCLPLCLGGGVMQARMVFDVADLRPGVMDIPAPPDDAPVVLPDELGLIIVPAVAFDKNGYRLGYGGGYYDRYLQSFRAVTMGIARSRLLRESVPREPHDLAVKVLVTEDARLDPHMPETPPTHEQTIG